MYAHLRPCDAKLSDGILTVSAAAAPPPPPGGGDRSYFDPARSPPPPPDLNSEMWSLYSDKEVRPRTVGICEVRDPTPPQHSLPVFNTCIHIHREDSREETMRRFVESSRSICQSGDPCSASGFVRPSAMQVAPRTPRSPRLTCYSLRLRVFGSLLVKL